jgi:peroxiredoxin
MIGGAFRYSAGQQKAPDFSLSDLGHRQVSLSAYQGKVVLLNFWATWCAPCLDEIPRFRAWQLQNGQRGLQIVGISMDDEAAPVRTFYRKYRLNYPVLMGDENLGELYGGVLGLPVSFLIDRKGRIRYQHQGQTDLSLMEREIKHLLNEH